ncbi:MAG TPA: hypothetical protein VFP95_05395 [Gammaproteobacteria bacterium]|nr:hypothetical protein [Gammaproteobacteria bacterium]
MNKRFWAKRFCIAFVAATVIISVANLLQGNNVFYSFVEGAIWGLITAAVYVISLFYRVRDCALCKDIPKKATNL